MGRRCELAAAISRACEIGSLGDASGEPRRDEILRIDDGALACTSACGDCWLIHFSRAAGWNAS